MRLEFYEAKGLNLFDPWFFRVLILHPFLVIVKITVSSAIK